ncbi:hypothetical protein [Legionella brunensis]|uniref:Queuine tRNA-ribosyltransferase n=1 Tax=Legionella brunensis TaxID=29422 RepID=A0A0W0SDS6_9GAMM|nr:hypothetical protein [Legionella brunensis]KTC81552.1 queuine tRNA-ribosyltransferase [Legionella brunensis]
MNQKQMPVSTFIPVLTTEAGSCLTLANWQEIGVRGLSYQLETLLLKPGVSLLKILPNLRSYIDWEGFIVLNASLPPANKQGIYSIRSPYDGSVLRIAKEEVCSLIKQLEPDMVILPPDFDLSQLPSFPQTIKTWITPNNKSEQNFGWYLPYEESMSLTSLQENMANYCNKPIYLVGNYDCGQLAALADDSFFIESNLPAQNAILGKVYSGTEMIDLLNDEMTHQHTVIDESCQCPTCQQQFTRAYLHHLIAQTPLLCRRFLIQHNAYYYQNYRSFSKKDTSGEIT